MELFTKKPQVTTEDFCEKFYDDFIFSSKIGEADPWDMYCKVSHEQISEFDPSFNTVDLSSFRDELLALRLEVFGVVWFIHMKIDLSPIHSEFTRQYLLNENLADLWDSMEVYNQAVAKSATGGWDSNTRSGRYKITFNNSMRAQMFDKWMTVVSNKDAARAANRIGCKKAWKSKKVHIYLFFALTDQLQCEVNDEARKVIMSIIKGFFDGISDELKKVKIIGSYLN